MRAVLALALLALVSSLPFYALAQGDATVQVKKSRTYTVAPDRGAFMLYQGPNGETLCRDATPNETRAMRNGASNELRQINHLKNESQSVESATGLTIVLRATAQLDANPEAKQAFIAAAAKWEALIKDPITINIDVDFGTTFFGTPFTGPNVLGATDSPQLFFNGDYPDVRSRLISHAGSPSELALANALPAGTVPTDLGSVDTVLLTSPLLRALGVLPPDVANDTQSVPGPRIGFNSAFGFDFDPSDGITGNRTDFDAVAVHEMGHVLGFSSEVGDRELDPSSQLFVTVWDLFRFRPGTANLNNFSTAQRILSSGGTQVQFNGGPELELSTARPDGTGGDGNQAAHWKDDSLNGGNFIGIMDPAIRRNMRETMTDNDQGAIDSFGYTIGGTTGPPNDNFANAQAISGSSGSVSGTNAFATREAGEPTNPPGTGGGRSVWYNWTAPGTGPATFDTNGSSYDTILAIYTGTSVNALTHIVSNDDISPITDPEPRNIQSLVTFSVTAGTTYRIQVDGFDGDQGSIVLHWSGPAGTPTPSPSPSPSPSPTPSPNPIDTPDFFVRQHYSDFLNRQPDQSGLDFWVKNITDCGTNQGCIAVARINVSGAFFLSIEFQQTGYLVERIYKTSYGDFDGPSTLNGPHTLKVPIVRFASEFLPDTQTIGLGVVVGQGNWQQQLEDNKNAFAAQFVTRSRFTNAYPTAMPPAAFVSTLNSNAGNPLSATELNTLTSEHVAGTKSRAQVLRQIAEHANLVNAEFNKAFVLMQFFGYLRRDPNSAPDTDYTGYDFWLTKLNQFNGNFQNAEMVKAFITSDEYRHRFGP